MLDEVPSTSRGNSSGLTRLVIPDVDSDTDDNSDLEVVDVIKPKTRKTTIKDQVVVELSDSENSDTEKPNTINAKISRQLHPSYIPSSVFDPDEPVVISSDDENDGPSTSTSQDYNSLNMTDSMRIDKRNMNSPPIAVSSAEDDLIVHDIIVPVAEKQIVKPERNRRLNHIYEKSTIHAMFDQTRERSLAVKCPYKGCNCKDFKKTDLLKDRELLEHLNKVREEKKKAENEKRKIQMKAWKDKRKRKADRNGGDISAGSIVEEVIDMIIVNGNEEPARKKEVLESVRSNGD